jgi:uncharacterized RDD family membrane protein YckC
VSDTPQGPGWWQASDGKWYPPEQAPGGQPAGVQPSTGAAAAGSPHGTLAEWGPRALGIIIDWAAIIAIAIVGWILALILGAIADVLALLAWLLVWAVTTVYLLYMGYLVGLKGRSPGMAIMGLRCVGEETGQVIGGGQGVVRTIAHIIDSLICYIGWLFPLWDAKKQTIADKLIKTVVLADQPKEQFSVDLYKP